MPIATKRWPWVVLAAAGLAAVLRLTLVPSTGQDTGTFETCVLCGELGLSDFLGNIALFMPAAAGLYLAGVRARTTIALLFALSASIELAQLWIPGRDSALGDVLSNTLGAALAVGLAYWLPKRRRTTRSSLVAAACAIGAMAAIGFTFAPSFPRTIYYGQWTPDLGQYETYRGEVLSAEIGGLPMHSWRLGNSKTVRSLLLAGDTVRVKAVAGPEPSAVAPIFNIYDIDHNEILLLGADRGDLVTHVRLRATDLLLRQPDLRWREALAGVKPGDTISLAFRRYRPGVCVALNGRERCGMAYTLGEAWGMIQFPDGLSGADRTALDVLFMIGLGLCAGLFIQRRPAGYLAAAAIVAGAVMVPILVGLGATPVLQVGGLAAGLGGGMFIP